MSLLSTYAKSHCANWSCSNGCYLHEVITFEPKAMATAGKCILENGETCRYFKACILPIAPPPIQGEYMKIDKSIKAVKTPKCPKSKKGMR